MLATHRRDGPYLLAPAALALVPPVPYQIGDARAAARLMTDDIAIHRIDGPAMPADIGDQVDAIFFASSGRSSFASPEDRAAFRERWLGRYLKGGSDVVLIADDRSGAVAGYLVGALDDPAGQERFADIDYFRGAFRDLCRRYPAHLHINLAAAARNRGIGARLIAAFAGYAAAAGAPGLHVVTAKGARNVRFYARCGFAEAGATSWNGREVVFLAKPLERGRPVGRPPA
jgi:GNAT superfamily N-acetyltransferase